jgi:hypothetical protein
VSVVGCWGLGWEDIPKVNPAELEEGAKPGPNPVPKEGAFPDPNPLPKAGVADPNPLPNKVAAPDDPELLWVGTAVLDSLEPVCPNVDNPKAVEGAPKTGFLAFDSSTGGLVLNPEKALDENAEKGEFEVWAAGVSAEGLEAVNELLKPPKEAIGFLSSSLAAPTPNPKEGVVPNLRGCPESNPLEGFASLVIG